VIHNAAVVKFTTSNRQSEIWKTNLGGTWHTLELCRKLKLRDFHYVSTAYVCGTRQGVIRETELEMAQDFRNDYEHSKFLAEKMIRSTDFISPATIYRPAVISGDSQTGFTNTYHGITAYMRLLHALISKTRPDATGRRHVPLRIALDGNERRNVVPVDWVSKAICRLLDKRASRGRTFHLAPRTPLTPRNFFAAAYGFFNAHGYEFRGKYWKAQADLTVSERAYQAHLKPYEGYEHTDPRFDTSNLDRIMGDLPCPEIDETIVHRYLNFGAQDRWGKRTPRLAGVDVRAEQLISIAANRRRAA
jgi:thioester reductase-like protein